MKVLMKTLPVQNVVTLTGIFYFLQVSGTNSNISLLNFRSILSLNNHIANVHEKVPCSICGEMISKKRETRHIQQKHTANADKKFKCKFCGKGFVGSAYLRDHLNTHTGEKPYICKFCGAAFASVGNHRMHERGHLGHKRTK